MPYRLPEFTPAAIAQVAERSPAVERGHSDVPFSMARGLDRVGRAVATVVSSTTGDEITVQLKAKSQESGRWRLTPIGQADRVYVDVPHAEGGGGTYIGTVYLRGDRAGLFFYASNVDRSRVGAAIHIMRTAVRQAQRDDEILPASSCFACGRELRRKGSIVAGFGPECAEKVGVAHSYGNSHQAPGDETFGMADETAAERASETAPIPDTGAGRMTRYQNDWAPAEPTLGDVMADFNERHGVAGLAVGDDVITNDDLRQFQPAPDPAPQEEEPTPSSTTDLLTLAPDQDPRDLIR